MSDLQSQLAALHEHLKSEAPPELVWLYNDGVDEMLATTAGDTALDRGTMAPRFKLPALDGSRLSLSEQLHSGPVVLLFFRGGWCPFCRLQLDAMNQALPRITQAGATLLAITPEKPESTRRTLENLPLDFPILHDQDADVARQFGLIFTLNAKLQALQSALGTPLNEANGTDTQELPVPAVFVVDPGGRVAWRHVDRDYRLKRAEPADILKALEETAVPAN